MEFVRLVNAASAIITKNMKLFKISLFICLVIIAGSFAFGAQAESQYLKLQINEVKTAGGAIKFSLKSADIIFGNYSIQPYKEGASAYVLEAYDAKNKLIAKYNLNSARFMAADKFGGKGGIVELNSGIISKILPYDEKNVVAGIKIDNKGIKTALIPLDIQETSPAQIQNSICRKENESGEYDINFCCSGLIPANQPDGTFICIHCGDGKCSKNESYLSCPIDCKSPLLKGESLGAKSGYNIWYTLAFIAAGIIILFLIFLGINVVRGRL